MRICLISPEMFAGGVIGGFGALTRKLARELSNNGIEVYVVVPRKPGQKPMEIIDNFIVVSYPGWTYTGVRHSIPYASIFKLIDADIYHSEEPSVGTCLAQKAIPYKKHIVTFQDPRAIEDWRKQWEDKSLSKKSEIKFRISYYINIKRSVKRADALFSQAKCVIQKAMKIYGLKEPPRFLPNPVDIPNRKLLKASQPTVYFLGRWDPIKNPELFFELAKRFTEVRFIAMGACPQPQRDKLLRVTYKNISNLTMTGWVFEEKKSKILEESWILINTSWKECFPVSYLEACAHKCAILSHVNADSFAENFGCWAKELSIEDFSNGLHLLLEKNRWRKLGERGYEYVKGVHESSKVIDEHIKIYREILGE